MKNMVKKMPVLLVLLLFFFAVPTYAATDAEQGEIAVVEATESAESGVSGKALAAALAVALAATGGALGMGIAVGKAVEGVSRQPEAEGKIRTSMMLGLVFIETAIIYALIVAILILFVL